MSKPSKKAISAGREYAQRLCAAHFASLAVFHRLRLGMTHAEVAKWAEVPESVVVGMESGTGDTTLLQVGAILFAFGLEVSCVTTAPIGTADSAYGVGLSFRELGVVAVPVERSETAPNNPSGSEQP